MIKSYAKLNLYLEVVGKREDGYHSLRSIMTSVNLHDKIYVTSRKDSNIVITSNHKDVPTNEHNLVYRIASYLQDTYHIKKGLTIHIEKHIPIGGGLAGGSSNGAAILTHLNKRWKLGLNDSELSKIALQFGSDIPYCLHHVTSLATSRGEVLYSLQTKYKGYVLIVNPNRSVSTKQVFTNYVVKSEPIHQFHVNDFKNCDIIYVRKFFYNELEEKVFELYPEVLEVVVTLLKLGVNKPLMSGSGASVFAVFKTRKEAKNAEKEYKKQHPTQYSIITKFR
ncbi:MAG TPA: 4-(cytidine 5'-diphospho)-2-C-methyl-D-erythritol kinase [Bacilli bacterium]|nr:4-(cytidine 5'-diphospho)-2-C-methyl-D-erythritol kinase [Bacilli bacterium]